MSDTTPDRELRDRLDRAFGEGPEHGDLADLLTSGRRRVRRLRALTTVGAAGALAAVAGVAWGVSGITADPTEPAPAGPAGQPSASESETPSPSPTPSDEPTQPLDTSQYVDDQFPASYGLTADDVIIADGWRIVRRVENPVGYRAPRASLGVIMAKGEERRWMLLTLGFTYDGQGNRIEGELSPAASADPPDKAYAGFDDWLDAMVELEKPQADPPRGPGPDIKLMPPVAGTPLETRPAPVIEGYTSPGDTMTKVRGTDGQIWFVLTLSGRDQVRADAGVLDEPTFEAFVAHVRAQVKNGEGLR